MYNPVLSTTSIKRKLWAPALTIYALLMWLTVQVYTPWFFKYISKIEKKLEPRIGPNRAHISGPCSWPQPVLPPVVHFLKIEAKINIILNNADNTFKEAILYTYVQRVVRRHESLRICLICPLKMLSWVIDIKVWVLTIRSAFFWLSKAVNRFSWPAA